MTPSRWSALTALCGCLIAGTAAAQKQQPTSEQDVVLVHRFKIPNGESWGLITVELSAGGWHLNSVDGHLATDAHLRVALRDLVGIEIGGRCTGWIDGSTAYPCGFSFQDIDMAGSVSDRYAAIAMDWQSLDAARRLAELATKPGQHASDVSSSPQMDVQRFVALRMPLAYLGDKSKTFGGQLRFEIHELSNTQVPSRFDRSSGLVILRARPRGEPS